MNKTTRLSILAVLALVLLSFWISTKPQRLPRKTIRTIQPGGASMSSFAITGGDAGPLSTTSTVVSSNVDVSNECGPQSETFITINPNKPKINRWTSDQDLKFEIRNSRSRDLNCKKAAAVAGSTTAAILSCFGGFF